MRKYEIGNGSLSRARQAKRDGASELAKMLETGEATANAAAHIAQLPKEEQSAIVQQGPEAVKKSGGAAE